MLTRIKKYLIALFFFLSFAAGCFVLANTVDNNRYYSIYLDKATIAKGYTVEAFDTIRFSLVPGILTEDTPVNVIELNEPIDWPWSLTPLTKVYQFDFQNLPAYDNHKPFYIQFNYEKDDGNLKQVFFFDKTYNTWRPLPTTDFPDKKFVRSLIHLPFARLAVFSYPGVMGQGKASWYAYKGGDFTASPDFPKGSILRIYNLENGKSVDVEVNDFGPDRNIHPERVVDLDKLAFQKIASLGAGVVNVSVSALSVPKDGQGRILGVSDQGVALQPDILAQAGIIYDASNSEVIWSKQENKIMPIASLSKIMAMQVFLNTNPDLNELVSYKLADEENNYNYCAKWESAKLYLEEGEEISVKDLIYSSLISSTNNTVETLVRVSGLSRPEFVQEMNRLAQSYGATSTHFIEPTGLSPENVSTVKDYAIIAKEVFKNNIISAVSILPEHTMTIYQGGESREKLIKNTNSLAYYKRDLDISGSKTGYLDEAGYCLIVKADDRIYIVFNAPDRSTSFDEVEKLIRYSRGQ